MVYCGIIPKKGKEEEAGLGRRTHWFVDNKSLPAHRGAPEQRLTVSRVPHWAEVTRPLHRGLHSASSLASSKAEVDPQGATILKLSANHTH